MRKRWYVTLDFINVPHDYPNAFSFECKDEASGVVWHNYLVRKLEEGAAFIHIDNTDGAMVEDNLFSFRSDTICAVRLTGMNNENPVD